MDLSSLFTTNEELEDLEDRTTNIVGYIDIIMAPTPSGKSNGILFKFTVFNGSKRIEVLVWDDLIRKYHQEICPNRVININGDFCRAVNQPKYKKEKDFIPFEIIVKENTDISFLGYHKLESSSINKVQKVTFDDIHTIEGLIEISGYVRTKFCLFHKRSGLATYGIGAITDGKKKITIQVKQFQESQLELEDYITVKGLVEAFQLLAGVHLVPLRHRFGLLGIIIDRGRRERLVTSMYRPCEAVVRMPHPAS